MFITLARTLFLVFVAVFSIGCGQMPRHEADAERAAPMSDHVSLADSHAVRQALLGQYEQWKGVPYRYGGQDRRGLDCSAFAQLTYRQRFGIHLPRETGAQRAVGNEVSRAHMAPGDLVFFDTGALSRHVGIYLGDSRFLHVSERAGVMLSSLEESYWARRFRRAVRVTRR
jgi:cell wall-associated NlpC family hydrolase